MIDPLAISTIGFLPFSPLARSTDGFLHLSYSSNTAITGGPSRPRAHSRPIIEDYVRKPRNDDDEIVVLLALALGKVIHVIE